LFAFSQPAALDIRLIGEGGLIDKEHF
jgi:hypothetical protein